MAKKDPTIQDVISLIDDLAIAIKKGFDRVDGQFGVVNNQFGSVNDQVGTVKSDMRAYAHAADLRSDSLKDEIKQTQEMIREDSLVYIRSISRIEKRVRVIEQQIKPLLGQV